MDKPFYRRHLLFGSLYEKKGYFIHNLLGGGAMEENLLYNRTVNLLKNKHEYLCHSVGIIIFNCLKQL